MRITLLRAATATIATGLLATAAWAHHGWDWTEDEQTTLEGEITSVYIGPPHPELEITTDDGEDWLIHLGNPTQTENSGFVEGEAAEGDTVTALGHRSADGEPVMKAVRITIEDRQYDLYPDRIED